MIWMHAYSDKKSLLAYSPEPQSKNNPIIILLLFPLLHSKLSENAPT